MSSVRVGEDFVEVIELSDDWLVFYTEDDWLSLDLLS